MPTKLYVGNLPYTVDGDALNKKFTAFGTVVSATIIPDKMTGRSKGFGFVEMANAEDAEKAIKELDGKESDGRKIVVNVAKPREERPRRESGGDRRDGRASRRY